MDTRNIAPGTFADTHRPSVIRRRHAATTHRLKLLALAVAAALGMGFACVAGAQAPVSDTAGVVYELPAQPLDMALSQLARRAGLQLLANNELVKGRQAPALPPTRGLQAALDVLLRGSGLRGRVEGGTLLVEAAPAASSVGETVLPVVKVSATAERETATGPVAGYVARRSATATKTDTPIVETPQSISVIGREELEARGASSVLEALRYVPGVVSQIYGADVRGQDDWVNLRGFSGFGTSLYQDGLRMNADANAFANQRSEPYGLERIEVLRGPASVLYGKGDAGGIVSRVSKRPRVDAPREVEVQLGNRNRRQFAADIGGAAGEQGQVQYRLVGLSLGEDTQDQYANGDPVSNTRLYLAPSLSWTLSRDTSLTILSEFLRDRNEGFAFRYSPPGASTRKSSSVLVGEPNFTGFDHGQAAVGYVLEHRLNNAWAVRQNARLSDVDVTYRRITSRSLADDGRTLERRVRVFEENNKQLAIDTQVEGQLGTGNVEHKLLFGLDAERQNTGNLTFSGAVGTLDVLNPVYGQAVSVSPVADFDDSGQRLRQVGLYAQDQMRLTRNWQLTLGGRMDWTSVKSLDHMAGTASEQRDNKFTGRVGVNYLTESGWIPYFSYAESFLPTIGRDASGNAFKSTQGKLYEVGIKFTADNGRSLYTAALFDLRKDNVPTIDPTNPDFQVQRGAVRSRGLELEAKTTFSNGLELIGNYTFNDVKITKSNDVDLGKVPTSTPKQTASAWLNYSQQTGEWRGLGIGVGVRHVGPTYNDMTNSSRNPSFTLLDAALHYDTGPWRLALNVSNLTNKEHVATCFESVGGGNQCLYGQERTAVLSARYRF